MAVNRRWVYWARCTCSRLVACAWQPLKQFFQHVLVAVVFVLGCVKNYEEARLADLESEFFPDS